MSEERFHRWLEYDDWANREALSSLQQAGFPAGCPAKCLAWLGHVVGTQSEWLARLEGRKSELAVWPTLPLDEIAGHLDHLRSAWSRYLGALGPDGLDRAISYKNTRGESWRSRVDDVLTHVVLHGAYHRGQIASELRSAGMAPSTTDFIHAARKGLLDREPG